MPMLTSRPTPLPEGPVAEAEGKGGGGHAEAEQEAQVVGSPELFGELDAHQVRDGENNGEGEAEDPRPRGWPRESGRR